MQHLQMVSWRAMQDWGLLIAVKDVRRAIWGKAIQPNQYGAYFGVPVFHLVFVSPRGSGVTNIPLLGTIGSFRQLE